ncbi:hypothetical protein JHK82_047766 [Glycine max]|nr:hypothetical protein JHK86_047652 [Glycine max]KAG4943623.1 hypothetical protein JHK85_048269 [Glycine max]KAG5097912.1 hypothetical protein JHK82_047766 [Glycine max]KAG5102709.1 hypothetical protein JHK84_047678 [Glycine max]
MARKPNSIMDITNEKETCRIRVRVINMWNVPRAPRFNIEMILMDEKADKIVTQIKNVDPEKWNDIVKMDKKYMIQNFEVENNTRQFRATKHAFKLNFVKATKIKE